jgi:hypothetical protein
MRTIGSLIPDFWVELAEILARSATGIVGRMALNGTSTDGAAIEIPYVLLILLDGDRVTRFEAFDDDQRDLALEILSTTIACGPRPGCAGWPLRRSARRDTHCDRDALSDA